MTMRTVEQLSEQLLNKPLAALSPEERGVLEAIVSREIVADDAGILADERTSFGERLSDRVAAVGGSWGFIIAFAVGSPLRMIMKSTCAPNSTSSACTRKSTC